MNLRNSKGFVGVDMTLAIVAVIIFSILIIALISNNLIENLKVNKKALATIYLTETLENIGIAKYEDITKDKIEHIAQNLIPKDSVEKGYTIKIELDESTSFGAEQTEDIVKKVKVTISYSVGNKKYEHYMERLKAKV